MLTHTKNQRLGLVSRKVISGLSEIIGNYKIVSKPGTPLWPYHRTYSLFIAERVLKITGSAKLGSVVSDISKKSNVLRTICVGKKKCQNKKVLSKGPKEKKRNYNGNLLVLLTTVCARCRRIVLLLLWINQRHCP